MVMQLDSAAGGYTELRNAFRWQVPERYNIGVDVCGRWASDRGRFALYYEDESGNTSAWTFWDIQRAANRLSNVLGALGTLFGDRVAIILPQRPQTGIAHVAIYQMGAVALPLSHLFGPEALEYRLGDAGAHVAIVDETTLPKLLESATACPNCATSSASISIRPSRPRMASSAGSPCSSTPRRATRPSIPPLTIRR